MINIRSITIGISNNNQDKSILKDEISHFMNLSKDLYRKNETNIRTTRLSMSPINSYKRQTRASAKSIVGWFADLCNQVDIRWFCVPFDLVETNQHAEQILIAKDVITRFPNSFVNLIVARNGQINHAGIVTASRFIKKVSLLSNNGFDNFRVGVSSGCEPHTPFFPYAYHEGDNGFSIALETVDFFIKVVEKNIVNGLERVREELVSLFVIELRQISNIAQQLEDQTGFNFLGIDASLAPFPNGETSVARLTELLGVDVFGSSGTLFYTSFLTNIIKNAIVESGIKHVGFNGVMHSLLEDDYLSNSAKQKNLNIDSLIMFSSVCGCGIDMVPIPGDVLEEEIAGIIMDIAGMSIILSKPLGVRVLPISSKSENEMTDFNYDFLVDGRIMSMRNRSFSAENFKQLSFSYLDEFKLRGRNAN